MIYIASPCGFDVFLKHQNVREGQTWDKLDSK